MMFGEHARLGRGGTRPAFRAGDNVSTIRLLHFFVRPPVFREARKTTPGAGVLPMLARCLGLLGISATVLAGAAFAKPTEVQPDLKQIEAALTRRYQNLTPEVEEKILALDPEQVSERDIHEVLSNAPAPRIIMIQGGLLPIQVAMKSFSRFIIGLGYPEWSARNPADGAYSFSSFRNSSKIAGLVAGYYEKDGLRPMMLGHSLGGIQVVKVLQQLAGESSPRPVVWNPLTQKLEARRTFHDPLTGQTRGLTNLQVCYACTLASGGLGRIIPNQWGMNFSLRKIPDTVEEFTGFSIRMDIFGGDYLGFGTANLFHPTGTARVRNVRLPTGRNHWTVPLTENLLQDQASLDWINNYSPDNAPSSDPAFANNVHILWAADVWHSIKRHWVIELQNYIRAKRSHAL